MLLWVVSTWLVMVFLVLGLDWPQQSVDMDSNPNQPTQRIISIYGLWIIIPSHHIPIVVDLGRISDDVSIHPWPLYPLLVWLQVPSHNSWHSSLLIIPTLHCNWMANRVVIMSYPIWVLIHHHIPEMQIHPISNLSRWILDSIPYPIEPPAFVWYTNLSYPWIQYHLLRI